jgi:hypothetical protein
MSHAFFLLANYRVRVINLLHVSLLCKIPTWAKIRLTAELMSERFKHLLPLLVLFAYPQLAQIILFDALCILLLARFPFSFGFLCSMSMFPSRDEWIAAQRACVYTGISWY